MIYSVTLFTTPISFNADEQMIEPTSWESVVIPTELLEVALKYFNPCNSDEYEQSEKELTNFRRQWLAELAKQGYTAARMTTEHDAIVAKATKESWK